MNKSSIPSELLQSVQNEARYNTLLAVRSQLTGKGKKRVSASVLEALSDIIDPMIQEVESRVAVRLSRPVPAVMYLTNWKRECPALTRTIFLDGDTSFSGKIMPSGDYAIVAVVDAELLSKDKERREVLMKQEHPSIKYGDWCTDGLAVRRIRGKASKSLDSVEVYLVRVPDAVEDKMVLNTQISDWLARCPEFAIAHQLDTLGAITNHYVPEIPKRLRRAW